MFVCLCEEQTEGPLCGTVGSDDSVRGAKNNKQLSKDKTEVRRRYVSFVPAAGWRLLRAAEEQADRGRDRPLRRFALAEPISLPKGVPFRFLELAMAAERYYSCG